MWDYFLIEISSFIVFNFDLFLYSFIFSIKFYRSYNELILIDFWRRKYNIFVRRIDEMFMWLEIWWWKLFFSIRELFLHTLFVSNVHWFNWTSNNIIVLLLDWLSNKIVDWRLYILLKLVFLFYHWWNFSDQFVFVLTKWLFIFFVMHWTKCSVYWGVFWVLRIINWST